MSEKKLSEELRYFLENDCFGKCPYGEAGIKFIFRLLLQKAYERIKEYEEIFPCKVEDTVYRFQKETEIFPNMVYKCMVTGIKQEFNTFSVKLYAYINEKDYSLWIDDWFDICQLGYEFYLTQEAAEKALKEMEDRKNGEIDSK